MKLHTLLKYFPRSNAPAWECLPRHSASPAGADAERLVCVPTQERGNEGFEWLLSRYWKMVLLLIIAASFAAFPQSITAQGGSATSYTIVDTGQIKCYNNNNQITCSAEGAAFYGQDAQQAGNQPNYTGNGNGPVTDNVTGLMWQQSADTDGDGDIDAADKLTFTQAQAYPNTLNAQSFGGYSDWRLPTIKEIYSLIDFSGLDPSGYSGSDTSGLTPFIDTTYFDFGYGDTNAGERIIDAQYASNTKYVSTTMHGDETLFGVNFTDGRIKGYGLSLFGSDKTFYVICLRDNTGYGVNNFTNNGDSAVTDQATGLMWSQNDSGTGLNWEEALAWVEQKNAENYLGHNDWRLPHAKELQSIVDYTRSPDTSASAAIDPLFNVTAITNEAGQTDYPSYWAGTTHATWNGMGGSAVYVAFGRAMGDMNSAWLDAHGAGAQRSDPKSGDPADWPTGHGPQGDAVRIYNYVRLVRDAETTSPTPSTYALTVNVQPTGGGTVSLNPSGGTYEENTVVELTANPAAGYEFAGWSGDPSGSNNPATLTVAQNMTVMASFNQTGSDRSYTVYLPLVIGGAGSSTGDDDSAL